MSPSRDSRVPSTRSALTIAEWAAKLQERLVTDLATSRAIHRHPTAVGDGAEERWSKALRDHLPTRYAVSKAFVIDAHGAQSEQLDVVIHDPFYSACLVDIEGAKYIPAESVYAVLEVKQTLSPANVRYAGEKVASVRRLHRTSATIMQPHLGGGRVPPGPHITFSGGY